MALQGLYNLTNTAVALSLFTLLLGVGARPCFGQPEKHPNIDLFLTAATQNPIEAEQTLAQLAAQWKSGYAGMVWDLARLLRPPSPRMMSFITLVRFLEQQTGQQFGQDLSRWNDWVWTQPYDPHPDYAYLKGQWYSQIDQQFADFFPRGVRSLIRLDEIEWGGVTVNGIPPLEYPQRLTADRADYLDDDDIVFGIALNGEARAYPKRILAWHEMALDRVGNVELTIVYCTLCGTVIPFESVTGNHHYKFGTSGLLYRSNKLMFDHETRSLWNTFKGVPVVGTLVNSDLQLTPHAVVTTTWKEWKTNHPSTTVLSLDTGYRRNYAEGAAYRSYFSTDALMFQVSNTDRRLMNKEQVLVMRLDDPDSDAQLPLAISVGFLRKNRLFSHRFAGRNLIVVTSEQGANRVYDAQGDQFVRHGSNTKIIDDTGREWQVTEEALILESNSDDRRPRLPTQHAFWFGWYAQFPDTTLIQ